VRTLLPIAALSLVSFPAAGGYYGPPHDYAPGFELTGHVPASGGGGATLTGSRIAAAGAGALAIDADSGQLVLADSAGKPLASLLIGSGAGLVVSDPTSHRAYVADRRHDRIVVVAVHPTSLERMTALPTPPEPYGIALSSDGQTLLVTAIADRLVVALDPATGAERWREAVAAEPRGVAIAPDGKHAIVTHLTADAVEMIDLGAKRRVDRRALRHDLAPSCTANGGTKSSTNCPDPDATSFARGAYAAMFLGNNLAVVAFQRESPVPRPAFAAAHTYGGSAVPITHHLAFVGVGKDQAIAQIAIPEPRALAYDAERDHLFVAGIGDDSVLMIEHAASAPAWGDTSWAGPDERLVAYEHHLAGLDDACGVDGLAIGDNGDLLEWCSFTRSIVRVRAKEAPAHYIPRYDVTTVHGPELAASTLTALQHDGFVRFHHVSRSIANLDRAACGSCHLDGRSDGLAWQIEGQTLRTPVLAGRVAGTAPYKWLGGDADLDSSVRSTIDRLGGFSGRHRDDYKLATPDPLVAYLEALPPVRAPARPAEAIARGRALFDSAELGCASCHQGRELTDHQRHAFAGSSLELDTPTLHGVAAAPRLLHDGSAATLDDVLAERGSVRGMIARPLAASERADLAAFLESL
jgi:hypothetical protein